ncbi:uncharacterized protein EV154DRAFT_518291 [Mucor mucedo]|uniref:uncharacterized protein n=1 Tax=Mucor mucedo TaxID=29922 RepID=UPI0022210127|nr:uncharacterized protein EV154DRAFT_518291 [Mucor mucedo]KAI7888208.1 hypothetical protein EV154DRAFT_518291 [Mucor mucedo]
MFILPFYFCTCFLLIKGTFASFNLLNKRQAIASRTCGEQNNTVSICSPFDTSIWYNDTDQAITWKYNNPVFTQYTELDLYLLSRNSSSDEYETVKKWAKLEKSKGIIVQHIDDSWYPTSLADNSGDRPLTMYMYIVGADLDLQTDLDLIPTEHNFFPAPQPFTLIQNSRNTTTTNTTSTPTDTTRSSPTNTESNESNIPSSSKKLAGWAIAVIVIVIVLFFLTLAALIWAYKRYKNKKQLNGATAKNMGADDEKIPVLTPNKNESNVAIATSVTTAAVAAKGDNRDIASIHSSTQQLWSPRSLSPRHDEISFITTSEKPLQQPLGLHSEANQSSSILSSTDALMIADTFRQFMRKPDWNEELELNEQAKKKISTKEDI